MRSVFFQNRHNFDGYEDIEYITDCGHQCSHAYLIYDQKKGKFFDSGFDENAMFGSVFLDAFMKKLSASFMKLTAPAALSSHVTASDVPQFPPPVALGLTLDRLPDHPSPAYVATDAK
ncbi:MAG: hypothetical protein LBT71_01560 [Azoarcus sp.]|jgi:hypothetical protein|nr:hypothetical protein [Azoarcus sp.]